VREGLVDGFSDEAREVVLRAREEAVSLGYNFVGTEHLLLGLLRQPDTLASRVLTRCDMTLERVRWDVAARGGTGAAPMPERPPLTPRARRVLELAAHAAGRFGRDFVNPEDILLAVAFESESAAAQLLASFGTDGDQLRDELIKASAP
jgi:ATP-dependent Clp protease ATP-binding subunit ClpC